MIIKTGDVFKCNERTLLICSGMVWHETKVGDILLLTMIHCNDSYRFSATFLCENGYIGHNGFEKSDIGTRITKL